MRIFGAMLIIAACGGSGFLMAANYRKEGHQLRQLLIALEWMSCELSANLRPLPLLLDEMGKRTQGCVHDYFHEMVSILDRQCVADASEAATLALEKQRDMPRSVKEILRSFGSHIGEFALPGQLRQLENLRMECKGNLDEHTEKRDTYLRNCRILGVCVGFAVAILLM